MEATEAKPETITVTYRKDCRACGSSRLSLVLDLGLQELPRFPDSADEFVPKAPLELIRCEDCGLIQLRHTVDPDLVFRRYYYRSSVNESMRRALLSVTLSANDWKHEGVWLDIGANDGCLLSHVPREFRKVACEPAADFTDQLREHADVVIPEYFSRAALVKNGEDQCDVITSIAMFYDLDDPNQFVSDIAASLAPDGVWINQLNDAPTMLKRNAFDAIVHEHLCYYDVPTLAKLYAKHGLSIRSVTHNEVNGGSVRIFAQKTKSDHDHLSGMGFTSTHPDDVERFAKRVEKWRRTMRAFVDSDLLRYKPLWGYGASTKLGTLLGYLGRNNAFIGIADRNPAKWGKQMGGTGIPIVSEADFRASKPGYVLVGPWAFRDEFITRERELLDSGTALIFPLPNIEMIV